ncbi:MAG: hypothetical protein LBU41_01800, partial [Clostridiales Family XIII bacterium]|nr:hypothetical protein [Clostridiales Family XIII bacterium]
VGTGKKYLRKLSGNMVDASDDTTTQREKKRYISDAEQHRQNKKREEAALRKKERLRTEAEAEIEMLESKIRETEKSLESEDTRSNPAVLLEKAETLEQLNTALLNAYETWESLL